MKFIKSYILIAAALLVISSHLKADVFAYIPDHVGDDNKHGFLHIVNATHDIYVQKIELFGNPRDILINKTGDRVFVTTEVQENNKEYSYINVIDTETNKQIATIEVPGNFARGMAFNSNETKLYVTHDNGITVIENPYSISPNTNTLIDVRYTGANLVLSEDNQYLFVIGMDGNGVDGVSLVSLGDTNEETDSFSLGGAGKDATSIIYIDEKKELFITNRGSDELINLEVENYDTPEIAELVYKDVYQFTKGASPTDILYDSEQNEILVTLSFILNSDDESGEGYIAILNADNIKTDPVNGLKSVYLWDQDGVQGNFPQVHPIALSFDRYGRIHVIKHIWNEFSGMYLARLKDSTNNSIRTMIEINSIELGDRSSTLSTGTFIGPECEKCPTGLDEETTQAAAQPASLSTYTLTLLVLMLLLRLGRRKF